MRRFLDLRLLLLIPIVGLIAGDLWVLTNRSRATEVTFEDALADYREQPDLSSPTATAPPATAPPAAQAGATTVPAEAPPPGGSAPATAADSDGAAVAATPTTVTPESGTPPDPTEPEATGWVRPADGVYTYDTDGFETLALGGARHDFPDETQAILRHGDGCGWQLEHRVIEEHVDTFDLCSSTDHQTWDRWRIERTFLDRTLVFDYQCTGDTALLREGRAPGDVFEATCDTGDGSQADATFSYQADETMQVDGRAAEVARFHVDIVLSGEVEGTVTAALWIDRATGMRLREERVVDNTVPTPLGRADYHEELTIQLQSLTPAS